MVFQPNPQTYKMYRTTAEISVGKSFLAQALGVEACHQQYSVLFVKTNAVLSDLAGGRADGTTRCACAATSARACSS